MFVARGRDPHVGAVTLYTTSGGGDLVHDGCMRDAVAFVKCPHYARGVPLVHTVCSQSSCIITSSYHFVPLLCESY